MAGERNYHSAREILIDYSDVRSFYPLHLIRRGHIVLVDIRRSADMRSDVPRCFGTSLFLFRTENMAHELALGEVVAQARKAHGLSLRQLADLVTKRDGTTVSPQYLNDIEHGRRTPSEDILEQLATHLKIERYYLSHLAGTIPSDLRSLKGNSEQIVAAYNAFRRKLDK